MKSRKLASVWHHVKPIFFLVRFLGTALQVKNSLRTRGMLR
jgi:hypothetical protein